MRCGSGLIERHSITSGQNMSSYLYDITLATTKDQTSRRLLRPPTTSAGGNFRNATIVLGVSVQTDPDREVELDVSSHGGQCLTPSSRGAKYLRRNCKPTQPADMGGHSWLSVHSRDSNHLGFCSQEKDLPVLQRPRALADSTPVKHRQKECVSEVDFNANRYFARSKACGPGQSFVTP